MDKKEPKDLGNVVLVGMKNFMNYVTAVNMQFKNGQKEVIMKARGKWVGRAVDVSQVVVKKGFDNINKEIKKVLIGSVELDKNGKKIPISTIEIVMGVKNG